MNGNRKSDKSVVFVFLRVMIIFHKNKEKRHLSTLSKYKTNRTSKKGKYSTQTLSVRNFPMHTIGMYRLLQKWWY